MSVTSLHEINYGELKGLKNAFLIDVRERNEIQSSGTIPGSLNIPSKLILCCILDQSLVVPI